MTIAQEILTSLREQISQFTPETVRGVDIGTVVEAGDGIARITGLSHARYGELLLFSKGITGIALNLERDSVAVAIMGDYPEVKEGDTVRCTGRAAEIAVGDGLIGRVVNPLGQPLDGKGPIEAARTRPIESAAPNVVKRQSVDTPVQTGIKAIDSMTALGRGQRELIIGDRSTGKTAIAVDSIINQKGKDLVCIYVAIGQKQSKIVSIINVLEAHDAMKHTIIVAANASDTATLQYLAPYAGCAIGEDFMEQGKNALIIYDDLSKHAWAYRQLSLLLRRPSGREAYPGDIFYLHSRLLERSAKYAPEYGGGSLTALPIIETLAGDVSAYVPTNVISITDGQIYLDTDLFNSGIRPALNVGLSVSRVGSAAQSKAMKRVAGRLRLELARYRELAAFAQFGTAELDESTRAQIERGYRITEVLKQPQYAPLPLEQEVMILYAAIEGYLDDIPREGVADFEASFHRFMAEHHPEVGEGIRREKDLSQESENALKAAILEFKENNYHASGTT